MIIPVVFTDLGQDLYFFIICCVRVREDIQQVTIVSFL